MYSLRNLIVRASARLFAAYNNNPQVGFFHFMHALIIEDEFLVALNIEDSLEALGFTSSETVATEDKAVATARRHTPDLITADVRLLRGSGITAVQRILREQTVPVVFITGNVEVVRQEMPEAVVVSKPFEEEALRRAITVARAKAA